MSTTSGPILDPETSTRVSDMPPVVVTTTDIPAAEHVTVKENLEAPTGATKRSHLGRWIALALAGVLAVSLAAIVYVVMRPVEITTHMGLTDQAWTDYRAGERAVATAGVGTQDWQNYRSGERAISTMAAPNLAKAAALPVWTDPEFYPYETPSSGPDAAKLDSLPIP